MDIDTLEQAESLPEREIQRRLDDTRQILHKAGAHYVIDTFDQLPPPTSLGTYGANGQLSSPATIRKLSLIHI